ncbi:xanthine dehydrogenase family protein molybdopterin-binding subunit [Piscinibacter sp. XHJ-5]|uniref:xanthine dehydrogenase family protein molybdopterin-binding subunit n=1 Tax=Piscinibacter sp. XHJ-5 TaxID=3037797 RepID=UPI0024530989|nr:xanthine dehydrogenase family protein molybdopterin-binding subunit [Piscinibacter sp. XHJ-5]
MILDRLQEHLADREEPGVSRRTLLKAALSAAGGLIIGVGSVTGAAAATGGKGSGAFAPNAFVRIDPDGRVTMTMAYIEMGQGTYTSIAMLIAEELEVDLSSVRWEHAPPDDKLYRNGIFGFQVTGGSTTIRASFDPMRSAGAAARMMLVQAAAQRWGVDARECRAEKGEVVHSASLRRLKYGTLVADAAKLPVPTDVPLKRIDEFKLIGTPAKRLDTPGKVNGTARYGIDTRVPGMKVATLMQAPAYGGRLRSVNDRAARAVKGVRQIVRLDDCVAVVADHMGAAKKGLAALVLEWDDGPNARIDTADIVKSMEQASKGRAAVARAEGDFKGSYSGAHQRVEAVYEVPFLAHATMEPMNCTVHVRKDECEIWTGTQVLTRAQKVAADVTGLPLEKVIVHNHLLGGGFGRRLEVDGVARAVQIARQVDAPIKVVWSREEDIRRDMFRPYFFDRISAGLDAQGRPVAWNHRITGSSILKRWAPPLYQNDFDPETIDGAVHTPYAIANVLVEYVNHEPPHIPTAFWRGVGPTHNVFVVESFIDELAAQAGQDPVAYRLSMLDNNPRAKAVLQLAAQKSNWCQAMPKGMGRGVALQFAFGTYMALVADVEVLPDGQVRVHRVVSALDCGVVVNPDTVEAQVQSAVIFGVSGALFGEITIKKGRVEQSNFHDYRPIRMNEAPAVDVHIVKSTEKPGGMGEPGTSALAPAVTNAIHAATGKRIRRLPVDAALLKNA